MTLKQYTIESMSYLTTGMLDSGEEDASVEAAMCKVSYILRFDTPGNNLHLFILLSLWVGSGGTGCIH